MRVGPTRPRSQPCGAQVPGGEGNGLPPPPGQTPAAWPAGQSLVLFLGLSVPLQLQRCCLTPPPCPQLTPPVPQQ